MKDAYSFDVDDAGLEASYQAQRDAYQRIFDRLGPRVRHRRRDVGRDGRLALRGVPHADARSARTRSCAPPGGYAANVEAVTTVVPDAIPFDDAPAAHVEDTPDTPTIDTLVAVANERFARPDRAWTAADTLKNVVLALVHPSGERELLVVGLPGDREVDLKRLEAAVAPAEVEAAGDADFARAPRARPRVHRPGGRSGPNVPGRRRGRAHRRSATCSTRASSPGTRWITGANEHGRHVFDLVAGRDFTADGTVEAAEVRAGDPAPDGSGPLELARGIEIGHIFALGRKYAQALGLTVLDQNGKAQVVTMGSYGIGVTRVLAALAEANNDERGLAWPAHVAPAHVHVVATGKDPAVFEAAEALATELSSRGVEVLYDDRPGKVSPGVKFADAELLGVPLVVVVGRGLAEGVVEVRPRVGGTTEQVPVAEAADHVAALVAALLTA